MPDKTPAFHLNTTVNHEPRIRDLDLAEKLGMANPRGIRELIANNRDELETYGSLSAVPTMIETGKGARREVTEYWLNEGQALVVCALSRTAAAAQVRKSVIDVFTAWRRGDLPDRKTDKSTDRVRLHRARRKGLVPYPQKMPADTPAAAVAALTTFAAAIPDIVKTIDRMSTTNKRAADFIEAIADTVRKTGAIDKGRKPQ